MNKKLKKLYEEDVESRKKINIESRKDYKELNKEDEKRRILVSSLIKQGALEEAADYHHAALIFQHGDKSKDYKIANKLAKKAMDLGDKRAKWLYAATLDRWLLSKKKPQKYGTQFQKIGGEWQVIQPVDKSITDKERAKYNVSPLNQAVKVFKRKYGLDKM